MGGLTDGPGRPMRVGPAMAEAQTRTRVFKLPKHGGNAYAPMMLLLLLIGALGMGCSQDLPATSTRWFRAELPDGSTRLILFDVAAASDGLLAVGVTADGHGSRPMVLASPDGMSWFPRHVTLPNEAELHAVGPASDTWLGVGKVGSRGKEVGLVLATDNQGRWTTTRLGLPTPYSSTVLRAVAERAGVVVAVGSGYANRDFDPVVWRRAKDGPWKPASSLDSGSSSDNALMLDVAAATQGFVSVGIRWNGTHSIPAAWYSVDGRRWLPATMDGGDTVQVGSLTAVAPSSDGYLGVGYEDGRAVVWTSVNGRSWSRLATLPLEHGLRGEYFANTIISASSDHWLVGGTLLSEGRYRGVLWSSQGSAWSTDDLPQSVGQVTVLAIVRNSLVMATLDGSASSVFVRPLP